MENSNDSPKYEVHFHGKAVGVAIGDNARVVWSQTTGHHLVPPMPPSSWVDREQEIGLLKDALTKGHPVAIWGPGGIGKTALAAKIASECKDIVGGIQNVAWFEIREDQGLDDLQNNLIIHFGEELNELEQSTRFDRVRALLSAQSRLLVFDQCENLQQQEEYFIKWLESLPIGTRILLAGRHQPLFGNALQPLNSLAIEESIKLFQSVALEAGLREAPAAELVRPICETLAGYPLAIRLAAPISKLGNISALRTQIETTGLSGVDAALTISYDTLNDNQKKHFRSLGLVTLPFDLGAVEIICELTTSDAAIYCAELTRRALLSFDETLNLYDMHPLIRRYAQSKVGIEETPETKNIHNRIANYYLSKQSKGLTPEQIFAYCDHLDKSERYDEIVDVLGQIDDTLAKHGYWNELTNLWERVVVHIDSFSTPEQKINAWNGLAIMYHLQSRWEKSLKAFNQILELDSDLKWHEIYVQSLLNMGTAYTNIGSLDKAYEVLTKAKDLSREWELRSFEPDALLDIGKIHEWRRADEQALVGRLA